MDHRENVRNAMSRGGTATITVCYRNVEGYHTFTSEDLRGLYVSSKDARTAFEDVPVVLKALIDLKAKGECVVEPMISFEEWLESDDGSVQSRAESAPLALGNRRYLVREAA